MQKQEAWVKNPSKKQTILIVAVWLLGIICSLLARTNFFTEYEFGIRYILVDSINLAATVVVVMVVRNYFKNQR